jgi:DNA helicase II / ATP-dependent DNA helicase PcrA
VSATAAGPRAALDVRQRQAVQAPPGPLLILAGAGSGKTHVLTERAAALARGELAPEAVLVITFTNRAADELRARLAALVGEAVAGRMTVGTFHAVCHRMLRRHARRVQRSPAFSVYDSHASLRLIAQALADERAAELSPRLVALQLGQARARLLGPADYRALAKSELALAVARTWERYERALERSDALDFDELLARGVRLLAEPDLLAAYRRRWRAVLVDEYQDTNHAQDEWVRRLAGEHRNLTVVADDDQAIYAWRGADVAGILHFERHWPDARVVTLERNYRSSGAIVAAAARLVGHNHRRRTKTMWTAAEPGPPVVALEFADEHDEAQHAAAWCRALIDRGAAAGEIAVLFRTRAQARPLEDALLLAGVPCRVLGGQGLWEAAAVRDLVAHLTLLVNPRDQLALARALKTRPGVGPAAVARVLGAADAHGGDLIAACAGAHEIPGVRGRQALAVAAFGRTLSGLGQELPKRGVAHTCADTVVATGLAEALRRERSQRSRDQLERLRRFCLAARRYERAADEPSLADFLAHAALSAGEGERPNPQLVTLATVHAAKGAEWDHVRLVGLCEGLLPHARALRRGELEEERRLAYVAMTRARRELSLSWPQRRHRRAVAMSRFVDEGELARPAVDAPTRHRAGRTAA